MQDSTLLKLALIFSVIGTTALFVILQTTDIEESSFLELELDDSVKVVGVVKRVVHNGNLTFFDLSQEVTVKNVIFENVELEVGEHIEVVGTVDVYNGEQEILVDSIKRKN